MLGIVLCGGQSSRMGMDKGLLQQTDKSFAEMARDKLGELGLHVIVSINKSQRYDYSQIFPGANLIEDDESISVRGPLLGIMSCHLKYPKEDLFLLACDLPLMHPDLLRLLSKRYYDYPGASAYLFTNNGEPEPLCGIYTWKGLSSIQYMMENGTLVKHSMKFVLQQFSVTGIELEEDQKKFFRNFNSPADLDLNGF